MSIKHRANNQYIPNVHDPLVINRVNTALNYFTSLGVGGLTKAPKPISLSYAEIKSAVGNYFDARRPLSVNLATTLLIPATTHHAPGKTKTYFLNWHMVEYWDRIAKGEYLSIAEFKKQVPPPDKPSLAQIEFDKREAEQQRKANMGGTARPKSAAEATDICRSLLAAESENKSGTHVPTLCHISHLPQRVITIYERIIDQLDTKFHREMSTLQFNMGQPIKNRYYHPIQKKDSAFKKYMFCRIGMKHHYDIEQSLLTIIVQQAKNNGMQECCVLLENMILDKKGTRMLIADSIQLDLQKTKIIINSLLNTTRPKWSARSMFRTKLNISLEHFQQIFTNPLIQQLQDEIDVCWSYIAPTRLLFLNGDYPTTKYGRRSKDESKIRAAYYFKMERLVVDLVKQQVEQTNNRWFREHDGWYTEFQLDIDQLLTLIESTFNLSLSINHTITNGSKYYEFT